jgi:hypothetical protein
LNSPNRRLPARLAAAAALLLATAGCNGGGGGGSSYAIQLEFPATTSTGAPNVITASQKTVFQHAADRIGKVIKTGLSGMPKSRFTGQTCKKSSSDPGYAVDVDVNSLLIFVEATPIDGVGLILGQSGPCFVRDSSALPAVGIMSFDSADLAALESNGQLGQVILHEMLHVVGFGTTWDATARPPPLVSLIDGEGGPTPTFTGAIAVTAYHDVGGPASTPVPVEGCSTVGTPSGCGAGTRDSHWTETVFQTELMTGWIDPVSNPLSRVTIGSLEDLGYQVNMSAADAYTLPVAAALPADQATSGAQRIHLGHDTLDLPPVVVKDH